MKEGSCCLKPNLKPDHAIGCFAGSDAAFVTVCNCLRNGKTDAEARAGCPRGILAVKPFKQAVKLNRIHRLTAVGDSIADKAYFSLCTDTVQLLAKIGDVYPDHTGIHIRIPAPDL